LVDPVKAQELWNRVLDRMVLGGSLTPEDRAKQVFPTDSLQKPVTAQTYQGPRGYLLDMVRTEIKKNTTLTDDDIDTKGLNIVTTIQEQVQTDAEKAVAGLLDGTLAGEKPNPLMKVGLTTIDPADGGIVALYGGPDFIANPGQNTVTQGAAQAGSTFKPFTLVAALENGVSLNKTYNGATPQMFNGWKVGNFGNVPFGDIDLVAATANSVNTVYAQLNLDVGPAKTADVATRAGVRTSKVDTNPANVLGTDTVTPLEMAGAYATFAAKGNRNAPFIVREATKLSDGSVAYRVAAQPEQVFKADVMADATYAMTKVVQEGSGKQWVKPLNRPIAGKTGTSTDNKSAWFIGFTPQLATAVAFYQPQPDGSGNQDVITHFGKGVTQITGGTWPAALWASYMKQVFTLPKYSTVVPFPAAAHVNSKTATPAPVPSSSGSTKPAPATSAAPTTTVPGGLVGSTQADAEAAIVNAGLSAIASSAPDATVAKGRVISASPGVGSSVAPGSTVTIVVSSGPPKTPVTPPPSPSPSRAPVPPVPNP
jgi:membrane peptidoglycan carboxypeptidase